MADTAIPPDQREFQCKHCAGNIRIPIDLPVTTGPCPHCAGAITSPAPDAAILPVSPPPYQVAPVIPTLPPAHPDILPTTVVAVEAPSISTVVETPGEAKVIAPSPEYVYIPPQPTTPPPAATLTNPEPVPAIVAADVSEAELYSHEPPPLPSAAYGAKTTKTATRLPIALVAILLTLIASILGYLFLYKKPSVTQPEQSKTPGGKPKITQATPPLSKESEANYIRVGWQKDAYQLLSNYMAAKDSVGKVPFVMNGNGLREKIYDFYGGSIINDSDTPAEAFSAFDLPEEDRKRGLFMMIYDQPPQFDMKEFFRPLARLEVQYGLEEADILLSTMSKVGNFSMEPLRVHAFFKRTSEGLKLDWETFVQTKYRTLQNFAEFPQAGQAAIFRVIIVEDIPEKGQNESIARTYRVIDPANINDSARVIVKVDSDAGRALSPINWRGAKDPHPITKTATVELKWIGEADSKTPPQLEINRFICWEFIGLGGQETPTTASTN
jgi:hypothetical protein